MENSQRTNLKNSGHPQMINPLPKEVDQEAGESTLIWGSKESNDPRDDIALRRNGLPFEVLTYFRVENW
jgi:hypothetical protein